VKKLTFILFIICALGGIAHDMYTDIHSLYDTEVVMDAESEKEKENKEEKTEKKEKEIRVSDFSFIAAQDNEDLLRNGFSEPSGTSQFIRGVLSPPPKAC